MRDVGLVALENSDRARLRCPPETWSQTKMLEADIGGRYLLHEPCSHQEISVQGTAGTGQQAPDRPLLADDLSDQSHRVVVQVHPADRKQPHAIGHITLDCRATLWMTTWTPKGVTVGDDGRPGLDLWQEESSPS